MRKFLVLLSAFLLCGILGNAQEKSITGRVVDEKGNGVPFASVSVKGSRSGTVADADGNFVIRASSSQSLVVSGTGFTSKVIPVGSGTTLLVTVDRSANTLSEVVVTSLGIKRESKALGYSTSTLNSDQLNIAKPINVAQGLMGQVAGAQISIINNGVNPEVRIQLRGERHISSDNQPLMVVDGLLVRSDFIATLNPEDIESINVLKSASAAALYGSEATNGVIIITTKKGSKNGKPVVNFTQTGTMEKLAYFPALQNKFSGYGGEAGTFFPGTPYQFDAINPFTGFVNYIPFENQSYGPEFDGNPANGYVGIPNANGDVLKTPFAAVPGDARKSFFNTGFTTQTDLSVSSGDTKNSNYLGLQWVNVKGTVPKDQAQRANVRFAGKRTYGKFWYDYSINYAYNYSNTVGDDITAGWPLYWTLLNTPANIPLAQLKNWQDPNSFGSLNLYPNAYYINPWWQIDNSRDVAKKDNVQGALSLNIQPTSWFTATYRLSALVTSTVSKSYRNQATFSPWSQQAFGPPIYGTPYSGNIAGGTEDRTDLQRRLQQDVLLTFKRKFGDIDATLILGNSIGDRYSNFQYHGVGNSIGDFGGSPQGQTNGLVLPAIYNINYYFGIPNVNQGVSDSRLIGVFGDLQLAYKNYLFLHGSYRRDYSSLLAPGHNAYNVYSGDASFVFSDVIPALKTSSVLSFGKLRAAVSHTGQITLAPYSTTNTFNVPDPYPYGGLASLALNGTYNNPANVPEATLEFEGGVDLGFLKNRITFSFNAYKDKNFNQLFGVSVSSSTGFTSAKLNAAQTTSHGYEFDLKTRPVSTKDLKWDVGANLAIQTTVVDKLYGTGANATQKFGIGNSNEAIVGMDFPQMYVTDLNRDSASGKVIVNPVTGYPSLNSTAIPVGRTTPKYILGLTSTLTYKDFTFSVIGDYRGGYVFFNNAEQNLDFTGASQHTASNGRQNFIYPNSVVLQNGKYVDNTNVYTQDGNLSFWVSSDYRKAGTSYVENAAAWKVRSISLGYDFTKFIASKQNVIKGAKLTVLCNNALMFRPKENNFTDPEFNNGNVNGLGFNTYYQLPPTRQFSAILNLTF